MKSKWYNQWFACGERIQLHRKQMGLSREDLAEMIDISDKNLGRIESGRQSTSVETLYKISSVLNVSMDYLLIGNNEPINEDTTVAIQSEREQIDELLNHCSPIQLKYLYQVIRAAFIFHNIPDGEPKEK